MSGGHFDYKQYGCEEIADAIDRLIANNDSTEKNEFGDETGRHFSAETIAKFKDTAFLLRKVEKMVTRIDWLVCSDDCEKSFHQRWGEEISNHEL
ncbi:MAG: hypothetical protein ACU843_12815 [Gammaproteobacteria bacterium]